MTGYAEELELVLLEAGISKDLERWRLTVSRQCVHEVWAESARAGRKSVDKEDDWEDGSVQLAIQRKESEVHGLYTNYLKSLLASLDDRLAKLDGD